MFLYGELTARRRAARGRARSCAAAACSGLGAGDAQPLRPTSGRRACTRPRARRSSPRASRSSRSTCSSRRPPRSRTRARSPRSSARAASRGFRGCARSASSSPAGVAQVSMNVERPLELPLAEVVDAVARLAPVASAELVGLAPAAAFEGFPEDLPIPGFDPRPPPDRERTRLRKPWLRPDASARPSTAATPPAWSSRAGAPGASRPPPRRAATRARRPRARSAEKATARPAADVARRVLPRDGRRGAAAARRDPGLQARQPNQAIALFPIVLLLYVPISYYTDKWVYERRQRKKAGARRGEGRRDERAGRPRVHGRAGAGELLHRPRRRRRRRAR